MNILLKLSARHLRLNRKRTAITVVGIALSIAMVTAISGFIVSFQDMLYHDSVNRDGLWHVRYSGLDAATAEAVAREPIFSGHEITEDDEGVTLTLLFTKLDRLVFDHSEEICARYGIEKEQVNYHNNLLIAKGIIPAGYYETLYAFAAILLTLVAIASVMVIYNAFSISAAERGRQFGLLKSMGATGKQVRNTVLWEGVILGGCAIPPGILIGIFAEWVALTVANSILGSMDAINFRAEFRVIVAPWVLLLAVTAAFATIFLAAWLPARRASRLSPIDAIRQTADIKVRPRDVRVSPLTGRLFGFEGLLASKTMRRNRRRYRTTVISLVVSIVLFIGVSSFGQMLFKASSMVYEDYGSNVRVLIHGQDQVRQDRLGLELASLEGVRIYPYRELHGKTQMTEQWMTASGLEMLGAGEKNVYLYSLSDESFSSLCRSLRLDPAGFDDAGTPGAVLLNTSGTYIRQGRRHNFTPYRQLTGQIFDFSILGNPYSLTILGETDVIPAEIALSFAANSISLIVTEETRAALQPESMSDTLSITAMALDAAAFTEQAEALLSGELMDTEYFVTNYEALAENNRNIWLLIMIFVYGFIAMLSLISVTNVVTTISTGISLRRRELAMLRSIGMTQRDIVRSLRYESLIYGAKSLLLGIPLGIGVSLAMYLALDGSMSFEYIWPVQSILISIVAVMLITVSTMGFASSRQRRENIVGVLTSEIA